MMLMFAMIKIHFNNFITIRAHQMFYLLFFFCLIIRCFHYLMVDKFTYDIYSNLYIIIFCFFLVKFFVINVMWNLTSMWNLCQFNE
jgi:hypothetical protein